MRFAVYVRLFLLRSALASALLRTRIRLRAFASGARVRMYVGSQGTRLERGIRVDVGRGTRANLVIDQEVSIGPGSSVSLSGGTIALGRGTRLGPRTHLETSDELIVQNDVEIGTGSVLRALGEVEVQRGARLEEYVTVANEPGRSIRIGAGSTIGPHATVGPGATVAPLDRVDPHAFVQREVESRGVAAPSPGAAPDVSVVVTTLNRVSLLPGLFEALRRQTLPAARFELVVTDDGSTDETETVLLRHADRMPFSVTVSRHPSPRGPGAGRNTAWRAARAPLIAFTDDDCVPSPDWLQQAILAADLGYDMVQGRTLPMPRELVHFRNFADTHVILGESPFHQTCNMVYRRRALEAVGGFDESFRHSGEDADLGWRVRKAGFTSAYSKELLVHHLVHRRGLIGHLRAFWKFHDVARMVKRHPEARRGYALRIFTRWDHAWFVAAVAGGVAGWLLTPWAFLACVPYARILVSFRIESTALPLRLLRAPARVIADAAETLTLLVGSVRHRTPLL